MDLEDDVDPTTYPKPMLPLALEGMGEYWGPVVCLKDSIIRGEWGATKIEPPKIISTGAHKFLEEWCEENLKGYVSKMPTPSWLLVGDYS